MAPCMDGGDLLVPIACCPEPDISDCLELLHGVGDLPVIFS